MPKFNFSTANQIITMFYIIQFIHIMDNVIVGHIYCDQRPPRHVSSSRDDGPSCLIPFEKLRIVWNLLAI